VTFIKKKAKKFLLTDARIDRKKNEDIEFIIPLKSQTIYARYVFDEITKIINSNSQKVKLKLWVMSFTLDYDRALQVTLESQNEVLRDGIFIDKNTIVRINNETCTN